MRFPNDTNFHLRMAVLVVLALFVEHLATEHLPNWSSPRIGVLPFVLGLAWVALYAWQLVGVLQQKIRVLEQRVDRLTEHTDALIDDRRQKRSLPPF